MISRSRVAMPSIRRVISIFGVVKVFFDGCYVAAALGKVCLEGFYGFVEAFECCFAWDYGGEVDGCSVEAAFECAGFVEVAVDGDGSVTFV